MMSEISLEHGPVRCVEHLGVEAQKYVCSQKATYLKASGGAAKNFRVLR